MRKTEWLFQRRSRFHPRIVSLEYTGVQSHLQAHIYHNIYKNRIRVRI